jgi:hypothetical protein
LAQNGSSVEQHAEMATRKVSPWIERLARVGYLAYGLVYVLVGGLALQTAFGGGDQATGQNGALRSILLAPLGRGLLFMVALGLLAYAAWRLFQGVMDPEDEGREAKGIVQCFDHLINGLFHAALALSAGQLAPGSGAGAAAHRTTGQRPRDSYPSGVGSSWPSGRRSSARASTDSTRCTKLTSATSSKRAI